MNFQEFKRITTSIKSDFDPYAAHFEMAPYRRQAAKYNSSEIQNARKAGVLVLVYPKGNNEAHFVLIERPKYDGSHSGQIAFPGGKVEFNDKDIIHTALREANEEANIPIELVDVIRPLTEIYIPPSNFHVTPILGTLDFTPEFVGDQREVASILEVPIADLLNDNFLKTQQIQISTGLKITSPTFVFQNHTIWGATAMILNELKKSLLH